MSHQDGILFSYNKSRAQFNDMLEKLSLLSLPREILRMIAMNLWIDDMFRFQKSSVVVFAATSDVSFYYAFYKETRQTRAIVDFYQDRKNVPNWKEVVKRLYDDAIVAVHFFYLNEKYKIQDPELFKPYITGCETERMGCKMGRIFATIYDEFEQKSGKFTWNEVHERISAARNENPVLVENSRLILFEDLLYTELLVCFRYNNNKIDNLRDVDTWLRNLDFADARNYSFFSEELLTCIIHSIIENIATGSIAGDDGIKHLLHLIPRLKRLEYSGYRCCAVEEASRKTLPDVAKVYKITLKEIIGKRKNNYDWFYASYIDGFISDLARLVVKHESIDEELEIFKSCLKWRFVVPTGSWRVQYEYTQRVCMVDDQVRDIFYHKGFYLDNQCLKDITKQMDKGCTVNFRKACERYLNSSIYLIYASKERITAAREACQRRAEIQSKQSG
jgi:hypothetical protein